MRCLSLRAVFAYIKQNRLWFVFNAVLVVGFLVGCLLSCNGNSGIKHDLDKLFQNYLCARQQSGFLLTVLRSFIFENLYVIAAYFSGLFFYGCAVCSALPFVKGIGFGAMCGYLYGTFGAKGVAFSVLTVIPIGVCNALILCLSSVNGFLFSLNTAFLVKCGRPSNPRLDFRGYHVRFAILLGIGFITACFDGLFSVVFGGGFSF